MNNKETALNLLNQLIEHAQVEDFKYKQKMIAEHQGEKAIGESWMLYHLKQLRELLEDKDKKE